MEHQELAHVGNPCEHFHALLLTRIRLGEQRARLLSILTWAELVRAGCNAEPALVARLVELRPPGPHASLFDIDKAERARASSTNTLLDLAICRYVDDTIGFFRDSATAAMVMNPAPLRSANKQLSLKEILGFNSMADLVSSLAARKSQELAHDDFQLLVFCGDTLGLPVFSAKEDRAAFKKVIRTRNVLVHNAGKIDARYVKALDLPKELIGTDIRLSYPVVFGWMDLLDESTQRVATHLQRAWESRFPELCSILKSPSST